MVNTAEINCTEAPLYVIPAVLCSPFVTVLVFK